MKIGVLTFYGGTNYGTALQAYALCEYLKWNGHDAEVIRYYDDHLIGQEKQKRRKISLAKISKKLNRVLFEAVLKEELEKRKAVFSEFRERNIPHSVECYKADTIQETIGKYDGYICGSDQIWTPWNGGLDPVYWLRFVPEFYLKVAYAPSMANTQYSIEAQRIIQGLAERFDAISIRETAGKEFLEKLDIKKVEKVLDPTLLLPKEWWERKLNDRKQKCELASKDYIFAFFLGSNASHRKTVTKFAKAAGLPVVTFPFQDKITIEDIRFGNIRLSAESPEDFLYYIKNARYVFTDSLHVLVFSIIFEKEFWAFRKFRDQDKASQNARIYELLGVAGCSHRLLPDGISAKEIWKIASIDYQMVQNNINHERKCSARFLKEALDGKNESSIN